MLRLQSQNVVFLKDRIMTDPLLQLFITMVCLMFDVISGVMKLSLNPNTVIG